MKKILQIVIPLGLAALMLWLVLKDTDFDQMGRILKTVDYGLLTLSLVPMLLAHVARAERWRLLLEPVAEKPTLMESFAAVMAGYLANLALPRLGEVTRCAMLKRSRNIKMEVSLGTVIAERAFDLMMLGLITTLSFLLEFKELLAFFLRLTSGETDPADTGKATGGLFLYLAIFVVVGAITLLALRNWLARLPFWVKVKGMAKGLLSGVLSVLKMKGSGAFLLHTLLIWLGYYLSTWLSLKAVPGLDDLGPVAALLILTVGSYGMVAPVQGGYGPYEFMVIAGLTQLYQKEEVVSEAAAILTHNAQNLIVVAIGAVCLLWLTTRFKEKAVPGKAGAARDA